MNLILIGFELCFGLVNIQASTSFSKNTVKLFAKSSFIYYEYFEIGNQFKKYYFNTINKKVFLRNERDEEY